MSGYVHVYTGNGKGKTTAALGLTLRAIGAGWRVFIAQFAKGMSTSELESLARLGESVTVRRYGDQSFIRTPDTDDIRRAQLGLAECKESLCSGDYPLVVLDEACVATSLGLFPIEDLHALIDAKPDDVELVITGRYAHPSLIERADLVTEMREVKHYYRQGVGARAGIDC